MSGAAIAPSTGWLGAGVRAGLGGAGADAAGGLAAGGLCPWDGGDLPRAKASGAMTKASGRSRPLPFTLTHGPLHSLRPQRAPKGDEAGSGSTGEALAKAFGYTMANLPSMTWYTAGKARSFCPRIGLPSGKNFTP